MNRHQVLTGAVNSGDNCFSAGSVEGVSFTAYAAGCNIVILASDFTRVQIIPGILHGNVQVSCLDASTDVGKIAVAFGRKIAIFEPTPLLQQSSPHKLDYKWIQTAALDSDCSVSVLSWSLEGNKLLSGGSIIQMWQLVGSPHSSEVNEPVIDPDKLWWDCVWRCKTANPTHFLEFSPDGSLFISAGKSDRLVKIWFESAAKNNYLNNHNPVTADVQGANCTLRHAPMSTTHPLSEISYSFVYIAHPRAVTDISWRKTSKYTPRGCCANMLVTSCKDNICRIWVQTLLPDDGMVNFSQIEELATGTIPRTQTQRHRQRLLQRIKEIRSFTQFKKRHHSQNGKKDGGVLEEVNIPIPNLPSTYSVHDFHTFGLHGASMTPGLHFHLAAAINAETDIPLVPSLNTGYDPNTGAEHPTFVMHWLNNKEMTFSRMAEKLLHQASLKIFEAEAHKPGSGSSSEAASEAGEVASEPDTKQKHRTPITSPKKKSPKFKEGNISKASSFASLKEEKDSPVNICDLLDRKFESLLRKWHSTSDVLFSIHPVDGSLLVWLVDWLDETCPGSFRQARVSFNARIPSAIALGDASTMSQKLALYSPYSLLDLRTLSTVATSNASTPVSTEEKDILFKKQKQQVTSATQPSPTLYMISKHTNGSLNQWAITFAESSNFTQVLSVAHEKRVCGHRFRVNDISCHPVLPLFLTTSHHNLPGAISSSSFGNNLVPAKSSASSLSSSPSRGNSPDKEEMPPKTNSPKASDSSQTYLPNAGFCSELILWKVKSVGPLSKSGGVTELARINSPCISAFSNVAWIPTLLPSHTLGTITNSSSACFIASDGKQLRIYQAIIDATTLLAEITASRKVTAKDISDVSSEEGNSSGGFDDHQQRDLLEDAFKIVSLQSTPRPGCILELTGISEATHDWQNTQLLHVFQDQLIRCDKAYKSWMKRQESSTGLTEPGLDAVVDLRHSAVFEEPFYLVVLEKGESARSVLHMWKLVISSSSRVDEGDNLTRKLGGYRDTGHRSEQSSRSASPDSGQQEHPSVTPLKITTNKVAQEVLPLPDDVEVIHACVAAGHLSSSVIYPACFAPYLICTACSDGVVRFWNCEVSRSNSGNRFKWSEWQMYLSNSPSAIEVAGQPLYVSCAYSGRVAIAYKHGQSFSKPQSDARYININLAIYECESTGGSEWILEDTIKLKNVVLPQSEAGQGIDLQPLIESSMKNRKKADTLSSKMSESRTQSINRLLSVPSYTTMQSLKKIISEQGNQFTLTQKSAVQVDWVSTEDGSHALTVSVGSKISVFTPVSTDIAQANLQAMKASAKAQVSNPSRMLLKQASMGVSTLAPPEDIKWMAIRTTNLSTADGLPPLPMQVSWVRDGILVVGMDNEMHIYTQWKAPVTETATSEPEAFDLRHLSEADLLTKAKESPQLRFQTPTSKMLTSCESISSSVEDVKTKTHNTGSGSDSVDGSLCHKAASTTDNILAYFGIFEAARLACPVLPQYHPKQLMELLAFGKIHRVRAILRHLAHSLCSMDSMKSHLAQRQANRNSYRSRSQSNSAQSLPDTKSPFDPTESGEEVQLEYTEITSIRPLPLFTLLDAESEQRPAAASEPPTSSTSSGKLKTKTTGRASDLDNESYGGLFDSAFKSTVEETLDEILNKSGFNFDQKPGQTVDDVFASDGFGPKQARLLTKLLTHSHLPGLSSSDQMHLLALADAVASFDGESSEVDGENVVSANSLDECGLRFLLCMRQHTYLLRSLPISQRKQLHKDGIATCNIVWAFHSETQEELVQLIQSTYRTGCRWSHLRELGLGWWIRNNSLLKRLIEQIAKSSFQAKNDPLDAALFYLAMKKKSLVWGLYRSIGDNKMTEFFQHNFTEDKWRKAALKNAYALLGKQRFEHAAAFFLLAGNVWDAVEICLNKLDDVQLAMVVVRLYEGDLETVPENLKRILYQEVLGYDKNGDEYHPNKAHPDPFLRSMAYWILQDYSSSLTTLLESEIGLDHPKNTGNVLTEMKDDIWVHPSVFNFYLHLRTKPLIVRRHFARSLKDKRSDVSLSDAITTFERRLFFITAHQHFRAGCPSLGLEVLSRLPGRIVKDDESILNRCESVDHTDEIAKGILTTPSVRSDFASAPLPAAPTLAAAAAANCDEFDWGAPAASFASVDTSFKIDITLGSEGEDDEDEDETLALPSEQNAKSNAKEAISQVKNSSINSALANQDTQLDIMAQQLKFIACLKIIMEELSTLATGNEVESDQLRCQLYLWLEKTVNALKTICSTRAASVKGMNYRSVDQSLGETGSVFGDEVTRSPSDRVSGLTPRTSYSDSTKAATAAPQILLPDKLDSEAKLEKCRKRKEWLRANEALLRTMLSYCSLHDTHGGGLASVRMELILLLQELQDESSPHQLLSPPPSPKPMPPPIGDQSMEEKQSTHAHGIVRIVHRDHDNISSFCINKNNTGLIAVATPKEIQELNIAPLLEPVTWLDQVPEMDMTNSSAPATDYLVVQLPFDHLPSSPGRTTMQFGVPLTHVSPHTNSPKDTVLSKHNFPGSNNPAFCDYVIERSRHVLKPLKRHRTEGTRRMAAHPSLPLYISGSQDGSVTLWQWNHQTAICTPRQSGTYAKVTHLEFNEQGNKFGVSDGDGYLSLWQVATSVNSKAFYSIQAHSKNCSDFAFLGCSSVLISAGHSNDHKNVCMWDTLLPGKKSMVISFQCHEHHGASSVAFAPMNQLVITGGRRGDCFVFDLRQRVQRHKIQAHESAVKCISIDPGEEIFATGSADGDIKVWSLSPIVSLLHSFPGEHTKSTLFRNMGMGVSHLYLDASGRLFSCGADGSLKVRQLPDRNDNFFDGDIVLSF